MAFGYDGLGRRTNRTVGGSRTDFWYDQTGLTLETGAASATYLRDPNGTPLSVYTGTLYDYGRDRLGSVTGLVTTSGSLNTSYAYDPWGQSIGGTGSAYNALRFTGVYLDSATGFYRMTQRFYQPSAGRFTQLDPLPSSIVALNRYAYINGNPVNGTDVSGLDYCNIGATIGEGIVGGGGLTVGSGGVHPYGSIGIGIKSPVAPSFACGSGDNTAGVGTSLSVYLGIGFSLDFSKPTTTAEYGVGLGLSWQLTWAPF